MASVDYISKIPKDTQFAVFEDTSYQSPGYDSRESSYTTNTIAVQFFPNEAEMKNYVETRLLCYPTTRLKVMKVSPVSVQTQVVFVYDGA